jgi:hypothetical protein
MLGELNFFQLAVLQLLCSLGTLRIAIRMLLYLQCYALVPLVRRKLPAPRAGLKNILSSQPCKSERVCPLRVPHR